MNLAETDMTPDNLLQPGWTQGLREVNGVRLHVVEAGPANGAPLILLHGFPEFWWAWRKQITSRPRRSPSTSSSTPCSD